MSDKKFINDFIKAYTIYNEIFENKEFLYIYKENNNLKGISVEFSINNFTHLTGIKNYNNKDILRNLYNKKINDILFSIDKFTIMKLNNFNNTIDFTNSPNLYIGNHDENKSIKLVVDKLIGNSNVSLGVSQNSFNNKYYPKSFLIEEISNRTNENNLNKVEAIFEKEVNCNQFNKINYLNKDILKEILINEDLLILLGDEIIDKLSQNKKTKTKSKSKQKGMER